MRLGLRAFLGAMPDIELVGEAADGRAALDGSTRWRAGARLPDVVLMDLVMPGPDGIATTAAIKKRRTRRSRSSWSPASARRTRVHAALEAGAAGYVLKDADVDEIVVRDPGRAPRRGAPGRRRRARADPVTGRAAHRGRRADGPGAGRARPRSREGRSNREIGRMLSIGERTVQTHLGNVLAKLELTSRTQAALWAVREGLVEP